MEGLIFKKVLFKVPFSFFLGKEIVGPIWALIKVSKLLFGTFSALFWHSFVSAIQGYCFTKMSDTIPHY